MALRARALVVAAVACAVAAACDDAPTKPASQAPAATVTKPKSNEASLPSNMVAAVSSGKTATVIGVHFALGAAPAVGQSLPVSIAVVPHTSFSSVQASFEAPDAVILATGELIEPLKDVKPESIISHTLVLQPRQEGVFLVTAAVETEGEEGTVTRIYSIPLIVNPAPAVKPAAPAAAPPPAPAG